MAKKIEMKPRSLHAGQKKIRAEKKQYNVLCCGRRFGKSIYMMDEAFFEPGGLLDGFPVAWCSPRSDLFDQAWDEAIALAQPVMLSSSKQEKRIKLINGANLDFWTLHNTDSPGRGYKYSKMFIDEADFAPGLKDQWEMSLSPSLLDYNGSAFFASTPNAFSNGAFKEMFMRGQDPNNKYWKSWQMPTSTNDKLKNVEKFLEQKKSELPHLVYQQEYLAEFVSFGGALVRSEMIRQGWPRLEKGESLKVSVGIDLAASLKSDADYNAMVAVAMHQGIIYVLDAVRIKGLPNEVRSKMYEFFDKWKPSHIYVEDVGYQAYGIMELIMNGRARYPIRSINPRKYGDKLTRFFTVLSKYESGTIRHSSDLSKEFEQEVLSFTGKPSSGTNHDDYVDALVYAVIGLDQIYWSNAQMGFNLDFI